MKKFREYLKEANLTPKQVQARGKILKDAVAKGTISAKDVDSWLKDPKMLKMLNALIAYAA